MVNVSWVASFQNAFFQSISFFVSVSNEWKSTWLSFLVRNKAKKCFRIYVQQVWPSARRLSRLAHQFSKEEKCRRQQMLSFSSKNVCIVILGDKLIGLGHLNFSHSHLKCFFRITKRAFDKVLTENWLLEWYVY